MIPPAQNGNFAAQMEQVLDIYKRPFDAKYPVICMDEAPKQLIGETKAPLPLWPGHPARYDYEYRRCGVCNIFLACEPLSGKRIVNVKETKTKLDWAIFLEQIAVQWNEAERITLVMDNLATHTPGAIYETYPPAVAKSLWDRFEFVYTPKHGSWLNIAEIELSVLMRQCLNCRIDNMSEISRMTSAWSNARNNKNTKVNWQFTTADARVKLNRLYPTLYM